MARSKRGVLQVRQQLWGRRPLWGCRCQCAVPVFCGHWGARLVGALSLGSVRVAGRQRQRVATALSWQARPGPLNSDT